MLSLLELKEGRSSDMVLKLELQRIAHLLMYAQREL